VTLRPTLADWLTHARAATEPVEVARCVEAAIGQAQSCQDWRTLLRGVAGISLASSERVAAIARRALERATAERDVWGFRDVANARATRLGDVSGARTALEAGEAAFRERARGYEWVLLGQGFVETLNEDEGMRRCLEAGRDHARAEKNADDLCSIATEWAKRCNRDEGIALLEEAEALASNGSASPWTLANAWRSVGDAEAVQRVLGAALARATSVDAALHVASAWASHQERPRPLGRIEEQLRSALAHAETLATRADDALKIAEAAFDAGVDEAFVRRAVERALALAGDDEDVRGRVSWAYREWLGDPEAASRVGPRGVRPEVLRVRLRTLPDWESSASGLFDHLRANVTVDGLRNIANADYGIDAAKHLAALRDLCETGLIPRTLGGPVRSRPPANSLAEASRETAGPLQQGPHEVLALTRWSSGETVNHLERALCCTLLCIAPGDVDELATNGPILAESCLALGAEASQQTARFFAWLAETEQDEPALALLLLFLLRCASAPDDARLEALAAQMTASPDALETVHASIAGSMCSDLWTDLLARILGPHREGPPARVRQALGR